MMNYLAHAFLSFDDEAVLVGNMISDYVKGKKQYEYPSSIQNGIILHRAIDTFTDNHPVTQQAKEFFRPAYRLYAGAFADIVYDHFLAADDSQFIPYGGLMEFTLKAYASLQKYEPFFPHPFNQMFPYMQQQNWLYEYQFREGIRKSFGGLVRRAAYIHNAEPAFRVFETHYAALESCYAEFFPELKEFSRKRFIQLIQE